MQKQDVLFEIKPKYNILYSIITHFWDILIFAVVLVLLGMQPAMKKNIIIISIALIMICVIVMLLKSKRNKSYFYRFCSDRFEYFNTYFGNKVKEIKYEEIKEVRYNQTFLQSKFNLGEIIIITNDKHILKKMLFLQSIPNVQKNYERIVNLFNT